MIGKLTNGVLWRSNSNRLFADRFHELFFGRIRQSQTDAHVRHIASSRYKEGYISGWMEVVLCRRESCSSGGWCVRLQGVINKSCIRNPRVWWQQLRLGNEQELNQLQCEMAHRTRCWQVDPRDGKIRVCVCVRVLGGSGGKRWDCWLESSLGLWKYNGHMHHLSFSSLTGKNRLPTFQSKTNKHDDTYNHFSNFVKLGYVPSYITYIHANLIKFSFSFFFFLSFSFFFF